MTKSVPTSSFEINNGHTLFSDKVSVPPGSAINSYNQGAKFFDQLTETIADNFKARTKCPNSQINLQTPTSTELSSGSPQIDLSLPEGAFAANGLHQIHPTHHRDQSIALKFALALASRHKHSGLNAPIICFLSESETSLFDNFNQQTLDEFALNQNDLIIITAKQSDDLLWAMEETLHNTPASAIIGHVPLLDGLRAQRLNYTANSAGIPCLLICNHKSQDNNHSLTSWSIHESEDQKSGNEIINGALSLTHCSKDIPEKSWKVKWQSELKKFHAITNTTISHETMNNTIH